MDSVTNVEKEVEEVKEGGGAEMTTSETQKR